MRGESTRPFPFLVTVALVFAGLWPLSSAAEQSATTGTAYEKYGANKRGPKRPADYHAEEARDDAWATSMESHIRRRFGPEIVGQYGLNGLRADAIDCRTSSCRIEVSWTTDDVDSVQSKPGGSQRDPLSWFVLQDGPLGTIESRARLKPGDVMAAGGWRVKQRPDARFATSYVVLFAKELRDPGQQAAHLAKYKAGRDKFIGAVLKRDIEREQEKKDRGPKPQ
jgi:hypothetical protein